MIARLGIRAGRSILLLLAAFALALALGACGGDDSPPEAEPEQQTEKKILEVYTAHGWAVPQWTTVPAFDQAMVLNSRRSTEEALAAFTELDAQGVPMGTAMLGRCHEEGRGVPEDSGQALILYMKARDAGDAIGTYHYYRITGKEYEDAAKEELLPLLMRAAGEGNVVAKSLLAHWMFNHPDAKNTWYEREGEERVSYFEFALKLDTEAADAGYPPSQNRLAWVTEHYLGDFWAAVRWRTMAVKNKFPVMD